MILQNLRQNKMEPDQSMNESAFLKSFSEYSDISNSSAIETVEKCTCQRGSYSNELYNGSSNGL